MSRVPKVKQIYLYQEPVRPDSQLPTFINCLRRVSFDPKTAGGRSFLSQHAAPRASTAYMMSSPSPARAVPCRSLRSRPRPAATYLRVARAEKPTRAHRRRVWPQPGNDQNGQSLLRCPNSPTKSHMQDGRARLQNDHGYIVRAEGSLALSKHASPCDSKVSLLTDRKRRLLLSPHLYSTMHPLWFLLAPP